MPTITRLEPTRRNASRVSVHLDGKFAFAVNLNVVSRHALHEGMTLDPERLEQIGSTEARQSCFDRAIDLLSRRSHARVELWRKLIRTQRWGESIVQSVLDELGRMNYLDDTRFARERARSCREHQKLGPRRAMTLLRQAGVAAELADQVVREVYAGRDPTQAACQLARGHARRLARLEHRVASRRLIGLLLRRGFDLDVAAEACARVLGDRPPVGDD